MAKFIIGILIGAVIGGGLIFYFFVGVPRAVPGQTVRPPEASGVPPGTAQIVLRQDFFNSVFSTIFTQMKAPAFQLSTSGGEQCSGELILIPEGSGVATAVQFGNGRLESPLAFSGSYNSMFGCVNFTGWANSVMELRFDKESGSVFGVLNVETVNLDGVNPVVNSLLTPLVQSTLNSRVNPVRIVDGRQLAVDAPVASADANLKANVKDVRAEIRDNSLNLFIEYEFGSGPLVVPAEPAPAL